MSIFPQIKFDKVTLTGGSKSIVVDNPHIDVTDGPLLLREKKKKNKKIKKNNTFFFFFLINQNNTT